MTDWFKHLARVAVHLIWAGAAIIITQNFLYAWLLTAATPR